MQLKRFEAPTMPDALRRIREDLGESAVILETRRIRGGLLGLGPAPRVEVLAAVDAPVASPAPAAVDGMQAQLEQVRALLETQVTGRRAGLRERLRESGVDSPLADDLLDAVEPELSETALEAEIARRIMTSPSLPTGRGVRVALVGPTGVGKTTTIAKLAARYALTERKQVAMITMDTYRIGAVEQIRTYARVMGLPLDVVESPEEMRAAVARHYDKDLVLIDTIGRSPRKSLQLAEIRAFLNAAGPAETHLVLSAPFGSEYLRQAAEHFSVLGPDRLILTKLDEMPRWGTAASLAAVTGLPLSFIADGQEVPRNLRPADAAEIARMALGGVE